MSQTCCLHHLVHPSPPRSTPTTPTISHSKHKPLFQVIASNDVTKICQLTKDFNRSVIFIQTYNLITSYSNIVFILRVVSNGSKSSLENAYNIEDPDTTTQSSRSFNDSSFALKPMSPLTLSSLILSPTVESELATSNPATESNTTTPGRLTASAWGPQRTVDVQRKEGESLGISIVG